MRNHCSDSTSNKTKAKTVCVYVGLRILLIVERSNPADLREKLHALSVDLIEAGYHVVIATNDPRYHGTNLLPDGHFAAKILHFYEATSDQLVEQAANAIRVLKPLVVAVGLPSPTHEHIEHLGFPVLTLATVDAQETPLHKRLIDFAVTYRSNHPCICLDISHAPIQGKLPFQYDSIDQRKHGKELLADLRKLADELPLTSGGTYYPKHDLHVAIVTDEFMFNYYRDAFSKVTYISSANFEQVLNDQAVDLLLFVSCWHGLDNLWTGVTFTPELQELLMKITDSCRKRNIPSVFQSIEDPSNYHKFIAIAKLFDNVFTTDVQKIDDYRRDCKHGRVFYGEYGINPAFNNPLGLRKHKLNAAFFAGSYPARYKDRCQDMIGMFDSFVDEGIPLVIANRNSDNPIETYQFPQRYSDFIIPKLGHKELQQVHKLFRYNLNFNSIKHSPTMCAMRVYELQGQGSSVLSNYAMSVANRFPSIPISTGKISHLFSNESPDFYLEHERESRTSATMLSNGTVFEKCQQILEVAGIPNELPIRNVAVIYEHWNEAIVQSFEAQLYAHKRLVNIATLTPELLSEFSYVARFSEEIRYESNYLLEMVGAFKFVSVDYTTKLATFSRYGHVKKPEFDYTTKLGEVSLSVFDVTRFTFSECVGLLTGSPPVRPLNGYAASAFGANFKEFCFHQLRPRQQLLRPRLSVLIPLHEALETHLDRVIIGLRSNKRFTELEVVLWTARAVPDNSLASVLADTFPNIRVVRREFTARGLIEMARQFESPHVTIWSPKVQLMHGALDAMIRGAEPSDIAHDAFVHPVERLGERACMLNQFGTCPGVRVDATMIEWSGIVVCRNFLASLSTPKVESIASVQELAVLTLQNGRIKTYQDIVGTAFSENTELMSTLRISDPLISELRTGDSVYFLYGDKWWISASWSGASVNVINEMYTLSKRFAVYYNDIYVNDLFNSTGAFDELAFTQRYAEIVATFAPTMSKHLPKVIKPSRNYAISFFRGANNEKQNAFFLNELSEPKVYGHNFCATIWREARIGFQNATALEFALTDRLRALADDGTLNYESIDQAPRKTFVRHQAITTPLISADRLPKTQLAAKNRLREKLNSEFIIGIGGTITESSYPSSLLEVMTRLRKEYPEKNISLMIYALNILVPLPAEPWIHVGSYSKEEQATALLGVDVLVNPWREPSQIYFASNRTLDAIALGIPYICPHTPARVEQLGGDYPLYHDFHPSKGRYPSSTETQIEQLLRQCMDMSFQHSVRDYLLGRREQFVSSEVVVKYQDQIEQLHRKRILIVVANMGVGGVEQYTIQLIQCLFRYQLTLYCPEELSPHRIAQIRHISRDIRVVRQAENITDEYDFAFLNSYPTSAADIGLLLDRLGEDCKILPIVHTDVHNFTVGMGGYLEKFFKLITVADWIAEKLERNTGVSLHNKTVLITPTIDLLGKRRNPPKSNRTGKIGYFGRVVPIKGVHKLVAYFGRLIQEHPEIDSNLHIYGPFSRPAYFDQVLKLIPEEKKDRIFVHNKEIDANERESILADLDLLVYTTAMDGLPYTYLEAMALGTPVVSTPVGGIGHLVKDRVNGRILGFNGLRIQELDHAAPYNRLLDIMDERDEEYYLEFKRVMLDVLLDEDQQSALSKAAIDSVHYGFSLVEMNHALQKIIQS
jgi:glycosyltransferase involved in cell wall biosynthesis